MVCVLVEKPMYVDLVVDVFVILCLVYIYGFNYLCGYIHVLGSISFVGCV